MKIRYKDTYVNYKIVGTEGKWLVFLHGWGGSIESFEIVANSLLGDFRSILIDFPPFGKSEEPYDIWTLNDYTQLVLNILLKHRIQNYTIISHSFGGRVAIKIASDYNNSVSKLLLIDSAGIKPRFNLRKFFRIMSYKVRKKLGLCVKDFGSSDYKSLSPLMKKTFVNIVNTNVNSLLKSISASTLIINGKNDKDTPLYMAKKLNKLIKNSALLVFENCGHFAYLEDYQKFILVLKSFLKG